MSQNEFIYKQHEENVEWSNKLDFYKDEIKILQNRLEEIAAKNNHKDVLALVEQFQNRLIIHRNTIDEIQHKVNLQMRLPKTRLQQTIVRLNIIKQRKKKSKSLKKSSMSYVKNSIDLFLNGCKVQYIHTITTKRELIIRLPSLFSDEWK